MKDVVYIIGAGLNQIFKDTDGFSPPMLNDFFHTVKREIKQGHFDIIRHYKDLNNYLNRKYGQNLFSDKLDIDIEELVTCLENNSQQPETKQLKELIERVFMKYSLAFSFPNSGSSIELIKNIIKAENPTILTFNYDCILDEILEFLGWDKASGYGFSFDEFSNDGKTIYAQTYDKTLLKLHGSINWYKDSASDHVILHRDYDFFREYEPKNSQGPIEPILITPTLLKSKYYNKRPFSEIWEQARNNLSSCQKIVIIGYSFPITDYPTKELLRNTIANSALEEIVVINPDPKVLTNIPKNFKKGVIWYKQIEDYAEFRKL